MESISKLFGPKQPQYQTYIKPAKLGKTRFSMIGTAGSGKTTIAACMLVTAHTKSQDDAGFYCETVEHKSNIRVAASNLRRGIFPPKTNPTTAFLYDAGLKLRRRGFMGSEKFVHVPIVDWAGETLASMLLDYNPDFNPEPISYHQTMETIEYVKDSEGFICAVPCPRAYIGSEQLELEPDDLAADPDVNLSRTIEQILEYKRRTKGKKIKGIAVVITKYDLMMAKAQQHGMDLYTQNGIQKFMNVCFPDTAMQLKYLQDKGLVRFFPSHVQTMKDPETGRTLAPERIEVDKETRKPMYSESSYMALFDYLEGFAS